MVGIDVDAERELPTDEEEAMVLEEGLADEVTVGL